MELSNYLPHFQNKKDEDREARYGATQGQKDHFIAHQAWKKNRKKAEAEGRHYLGIHDRFMRDEFAVRPKRPLVGTNKKCMDLDHIAQQNYEYVATKLERERYKRLLSQIQKDSRGDTTATTKRQDNQTTLPKFFVFQAHKNSASRRELLTKIPLSPRQRQR